MNITILLLIASLVLLIAASLLKITSERRKHAKFLSDFDARHASRTSQLDSFIKLIQEDQRNGLL
jgi:hypothetical protein